MFPILIVIAFFLVVFFVCRDTEPGNWDTPHNLVDASIDSEPVDASQTFTIGGN